MKPDSWADLFYRVSCGPDTPPCYGNAAVADLTAEVTQLSADLHGNSSRARQPHKLNSELDAAIQQSPLPHISVICQNICPY